MKQVIKLIAYINRINAIRELKNRLEFYPILTMDNANDFTFENINEILDIQHELKII